VADNNQIADLLSNAMRTPEGPTDSAFYVGRILQYDTLTGTNVVEVQGNVFGDVRTLSSGIGLRYNSGDSVILIKKQTQWFILGKVGSVGGAAGSGLQSVQENFITNFGTSGVWADHPTGAKPVVTANIGSSRTALVFYRCNVKAKAGDHNIDASAYDPQCLVGISFAVSGASTIAPNVWAGQTVLLQVELSNMLGTGKVSGVLTTLAGFMPLTATQGLNPGLNTFTMKYNTAQTAEFQIGGITVVPL
jgi:hypothetical protein